MASTTSATTTARRAVRPVMAVRIIGHGCVPCCTRWEEHRRKVETVVVGDGGEPVRPGTMARGFGGEVVSGGGGGGECEDLVEEDEGIL